jgi:hypothetical protein
MMSMKIYRSRFAALLPTRPTCRRPLWRGCWASASKRCDDTRAPDISVVTKRELVISDRRASTILPMLQHSIACAGSDIYV